MNYDMIMDLLYLVGGLLCGILIGFGIIQLKDWRHAKKLDAIRPVPLGYDPNNPINQGPYSSVKRGETDANGFTRLW